MKTPLELPVLALLSLAGLLPLSGLQAATTINPANKFAYGANFGWMDWRGDANNGAVIGEYICSGYIYAANVGWISLGSGTPANGIRYQNNSATDWGVNHDGLGNLRGYAWGANIGWINFENTGAPMVDLNTGKLSGYVWSANCGWISLSNAVAHVQTDLVANGADTDGDGLPDAWERLHFGGLSPNAEDDPDGDGMNNLQEYLADTNPLNADENLRITAFDTPPNGREPKVTWTSKPTRRYYLEKSLNLGLPVPVWEDSGLGLIVPDGASTTRSFSDTSASMRFYRVRAVRPLSP
jgi:hypothetical protein